MNELFTKIDKLKKIINIKEPYDRRTKRKHHRLPRPSAINLNKYFIESICNINPTHIIENESSDSNSMIEAHINNDITLNIPTLSKISKTIFDINTIIIVNNIDDFPKEAIKKNGIGLLLVGIESWVNEKNILFFLENVPNIKENKINRNFTYDNFLENKIQINYIKFFNLKDKYCAFVNISSLEQIKALGEYFLHPIKKYNPTINSKGEKIEFYYSYDLLTLTKSYWYGVILRNLPRDCSDKTIFQFCESKIRNGIKYCLNPIYVNGILCALVVCKDLEYAEMLCSILNNYELSNKKIIKANLHPHTCKIRRFIRNNKLFCQNGYIFEDDIHNEKSFNSKTCIELLLPETLEKFTNKNSKNNKNMKEKNININKDKIEKNNEINNNNIPKRKIKKKKNKINDSSIEILKTLKNILDIKNKNSNESTNNYSNNSLNQIPLDSNITDLNININQNNNNIDNPINNVDLIIGNSNKKEEIINNEQNYSKAEIEYYTYNFPEESFFNNLEKEEDKECDLINSGNFNDNNKISFIAQNSYNFSGCYNSKKNSPNIINSKYNFEDYNISENNKSNYENLYYELNDKIKRYSEEIKKYENYYSDNIHKSSYYNDISHSHSHKYSHYKDECENNYYIEKEKYFKIMESNSLLNNIYDEYKNNDNEEIEMFIREYIDVKDNIKKNLRIMKEIFKNKKTFILKYKKIMEQNKITTELLINDLKNNKTYQKYLNEDDYLIIYGKAKTDDIEEIIYKVKRDIDKKYLGKKLYYKD